jgi:hypothetical protein
LPKRTSNRKEPAGEHCTSGASGERYALGRKAALKEILSDWHEWLPLVGIAVVALVTLAFWLRRKPDNSPDRERERCAYLNRVGRIVEGQIIEIADHAQAGPEGGAARMFQKRSDMPSTNGTRKLLYYTYSISGVTYETAQDVTGLEERAHPSRVAAGQTASVKYDPANPSNSILVADDWSGLH